MEGRVGPYSGQCCGLYSNWRGEGRRLPPAYCLFWTMCCRSILNIGKWLLKVFTNLGQERSTAPVAPSCGIRTLKGSFSDAPGKESPGSETNRTPEIYTSIQTGEAKKSSGLQIRMAGITSHHSRFDSRNPSQDQRWPAHPHVPI